MTFALFCRTIQLRKANNWHIKFTSHRLNATTDFADFHLPTLASRTRTHQLQIIDKYATDVKLFFHSSGLRTKLQERQTRRVIDKNFRRLKRITCHHQTAIVITSQDTTAKSLSVNTSFRTEKSLNELLSSHFKTEHGDSLSRKRDAFHQIQSKRSLSHGRSSRHDQHLAALQSCSHFVDIFKSAGKSS